MTGNNEICVSIQVDDGHKLLEPLGGSRARRMREGLPPISSTTRRFDEEGNIIGNSANRLLLRTSRPGKSWGA